LWSLKTFIKNGLKTGPFIERPHNLAATEISDIAAASAIACATARIFLVCVHGFNFYG
jgi:hypothetical protein